MKLIDLLTNREIRSFALRGELNTEQISFPPGKEDYLYDQIAKAAWDRAKEIFFKEPGLILAYNKDLYDKYDYIYDDLAPQLNQDLPPSLGAKIKGVIKKIGIKRINSEGIEPVINRLAVGILEGLESKTGVYGKTLSDSLN
ncbi:MAG: hypothetical protein N2578_00755, partial [Bdellovibrionaceae bacterium]|nr:hypothetical protein [Pseudobdellovibrionaceae bacterium]